MVVGIHRNAKAVIDLDAIKHNIEIEKKRMRDDQKLFAVVKANAYGHGMIEVAKTAKEAGANGFCVAIIDEGIELRNAGFDDLVLILGVCPAEQSNVIAANDLSVAVGDLDFLENAKPLLKAQGLKLKVHLAFDTGMGRIGFVNGEKVHEAEAFMKENSDQFEFEGIFTHFACADTKDDSYYKKQLEKFNELKDALDDLPLTFMLQIPQPRCGMMIAAEMPFVTGLRCMASIRPGESWNFLVKSSLLLRLKASLFR